MKYFTGQETVEEAKTKYRDHSKRLHPDLGGSEEAFKEMQAEYEMTIGLTMRRAFRENREKSGNHSVAEFQDILNKIKDMEITIEIIGFWIYAKNSYYYKDQLKSMGFWFSKKHKAWIYSGGKKRGKASRLTETDIKSRYGYTEIKTNKKKAITA